MTRRVVVTGLGVVSPLGCDVERFWSRMLAGVNAVGAPRRHGGTSSPTRALGELDPADLARLSEMHPEAARTGDARTLFGVAAAEAAMKDAGLEPGDHPRAGVSLASGPGVHCMEDVDGALTADGTFDVDAFARSVGGLPGSSLVRSAVDQPAVLFARSHGLGGPIWTVTAACAGANQAIGSALRAIRRGEADWMVAGGADTLVNPFGLVFFVLLGAGAAPTDDPARACRPFDRARTGVVHGEGAGCAVLEAEDHARARGARIYAEVAGYGATLDAYRTTAPHPEGRGAAEAMRRAIRDAHLVPDDVDFVSAHGTGTKRNDPAEAKAIRAVFGDRTSKVAVSAGKSMMGHLLAAAAGVAFASTVLAVQRDVVPPTTNLSNPDPSCDLDLVRDRPRPMAVRAALSNAFAFGGQNSSVLVRKYDPRTYDVRTHDVPPRRSA